MNIMKKIALSTATVATVAASTAAIAPSANASPSGPAIKVPVSSYHAVGTCHGSAQGRTYDSAALGWYPDSSYANATAARVTNIHLQASLCSLGYKLVIDGYKGAATTNALKAYQRAHGLVADGVLGPATANRLYGPGAFHAKPVNDLWINPAR